jgi:NHLM bacteriocin system ABC transporter ATP-binding protein
MEALHTIQGNSPLLLDQPDLLYLIQSGSVAIFAVQVVNGVPEGERRYLFNLEPGEALFGVKPASEQLGLLAVAIEPAQLSQQLISELALPELYPLLEHWLLKLGQSEGLPKPELGHLADLDQMVSLVKGQVVQPAKGQVLWVQSQQGIANWLGDASLQLTPETGIFPLAATWIAAENQLELTLHPSEKITDLSTLLQGLTILHRWFLEKLGAIAVQEAEAERVRFQKRQVLQRQITQDTLQQLAAVLKPDLVEQFAEGSELLMVAGAVGRAMGVSIKPAAESETGKRMRDPLEAIARTSQLRLRRVLLRDDWWKYDCGALVAYTREGNRPVALLPISGNHYEIYQAGDSKRRVVNAEIAASLNPRAFMFYRPLPHMALQALDLMRFTLRGRSKEILIFGLMGVGTTVISLLFPLATGLIIDQALPAGSHKLLLEVTMALLFAAFGSASLEFIQALAAMRLNTISEATLQAAVWDRLLQLKPAFFRDYAIGDMESRVSGISKIYRKLTGSTIQTLLTSFFALISFALMLSYSPTLALVALPVALITIGFTTISGALLLRKKRPLLEIEGEIFGLLVQLLGAVPKLRVAGAEARAFGTWGAKYTQRLKLDLSTQYIENSVTIFNTVMPTLTTVLLFWLMVGLTQRAQSGAGAGLSTGSFLAFTAAFAIFMTGVTNLSNTLINILEVVTLWKRSQPILTAEPEVDLDKSDPGRLQGQVIVDHVTFRYREDGPFTLDQVSLQADPGEFIAIVGPSGSGKSTLLRLLLGFEVPEDGTIYYDGQDLGGLEITAVRRQLGVVLQNSRMNAGTIFENISANALISMTQAWQAAEMAGLAEDIKALPMGMHTFISEGGTNFSGGQRQRLMIARALALKPKILLFDEATSALDNRTQAIVTASLDSLGVTRIVIAHRLSTIRNADRIYVMQSGRVIQQGSFEQLVRQEGLFAQLAARQLTEEPVA